MALRSFLPSVVSLLLFLSLEALAGPRAQPPCLGSLGGLCEASEDKAKPRMTEGKTTVSGSLEVDVVRRYLKRDHNAFLYCYKKELLADPSLQGLVTLRFEIDKEGVVTSSSVSKSALSEKVSGCLTRYLERLSFPEAEGVTKVIYPLRFSPDGEEVPETSKKKKVTPSKERSRGQ